ncbi:IS110 family transposase [uncultured Chryseobacterium sp.]|uniref:IS110 family transposase n=2 Tax=uncultured Chryseobacterium sp. TaxID=259322 RepID=UPI0025E4470E|nr:IS110 family transposase [uncultured Chryseobacterium sp.]
MKVLKQVAGIDVAQKELVVTLGCLYEDFTVEFLSYKVFKNTDDGIKSLIEWAENKVFKTSDIHYVMEATGGYHQKFAYYLAGHNRNVYIVLPNKISNYIRTLDLKTITDKSCSQAIARFGLERKLNPWKKPDQAYHRLQQLTRERDQIVQQRSMVKNQLHAEKAQASPHLKSMERMRSRISFLNGQEKEIKEDINEIIKSNLTIKQIIERLITIPGVGILTAVTVLGETNGFELIRNKSQLSAYAGLDIKEKQSGTSVKAKPRITKKGNRNLRKSMYLPALTAVRCDDNFKEIYAGLVSKHGIKMKALVAVQRKILELIYVLFKNQTLYDQQYKTKNSVKTETVTR